MGVFVHVVRILAPVVAAVLAPSALAAPDAVAPAQAPQPPKPPKYENLRFR